MSNTEVLEKIKNAEIEIEVYEPTSRTLPTEQEEHQRRESLLQVGLINPIIITKDENNKPFIVDGNLRYKIIRELKQQGQWNMEVKISVVDLAQAKNYRNVQTNHKNYSKIQLAIYAVYHYWEEVEKASLERQQSGAIATTAKGKTSEIVGKRGGVGKSYVESAHKLLELDKEFFYNLFVIQRYSIKKTELDELLNINSKQPETYNKIIGEIKRICEENKSQLADTEKVSIYNQAYVAVVCPSDTSEYKNIDINELTKINTDKSDNAQSPDSSATSPRYTSTKINTDKSDNAQDKSDEKEKRQAQHDKNAKEILQEDAENQAIMEKEIRPIGISFKSAISEDELKGIFNILQLYRLNPILINSSQDLENFKNGEENTL